VRNVNSQPLKVIFMGTPEFAVPCLEKLTLSPLTTVVAVVTQPDRPKGRGRKLVFTPVKEFAVKSNIPVLQPEKIKTDSVLSELIALAPDLIIVVAFGQFLPQVLLDLPRLGCVNVHASLLPKYRGAAPIHWAIMNGETETGVTTMHMDKGMDTGDMILKAVTTITPDMVTGELHDKLMIQGAELLIDTVEQLANGTAPRNKQESAKVTYAPLLQRSTERIDWSQSAQDIHNKVRGLNPWPGAFCRTEKMMLKVWQTQVVDNTTLGQSGTIVACSEQGFIVQTGVGLLHLIEVQPESKRKMAAQECVCGYCIRPGDMLR
jgi:methionyl-tRNA formyltransferase